MPAPGKPAVKGGGDFDDNALGGTGTGRNGIHLVPVCGAEILHAAVCVIFGFYLASSSLAPDIANITQSLFRLL